MFLYILKLSLRKFKEHFRQFISIITISCIGVAIYTGINSVESAMQGNARNYFKLQQASDIEVYSPYGLSKDVYSKVEDVINKSGLSDVSLDKSISLDARIKHGNDESVVKLNSIGKSNRPKIKKGRLPNNKYECLVDIDSDNLIDKEINISSNGINKSCKVVGSAYFLQYFNSMQKGYSLIDSSEIKKIVYAPLDFSELFLKNMPFDYNTIYLNTSYDNVFDKEYKTKMSKISKQLDKSFNNEKIIVTSFDKDSSIKTYANDSSQIKEIALIFPIIFFLVSALVGSSVMSRMVDDERIQIGTLLALGYKRSMINFIYISFALCATIIGWLLGSFIGVSIIPSAVMEAYSSLYQLPTIEVILNIEVILSALAFSLLTIVGTTIIVSFNQTRSTCATLMRPKSPQAGKKILLERLGLIWNKFSFINKVSIRNIFRYKKRLIMSLVAIMGCSGLLMIGIGIESSISPITNLQYNKVYNYDLNAYTLNLSEKQANATSTKIDKIDGIDKSLPLYRKNIELVSSDIEDNLNIIVPSNNKELNEYIKFNDFKFNDDSVFITKKIAQSHNIKENEIIKIKIDNKQYQFKVDKIVDNYVDNYLYVNQKEFINNVGDIKYNNVLIKENKSTNNTLKDLEKLDELNIIISNDKIKDTMSKSMGGLDNIVYIMVGFAGLLVIVVMYTLTNLNLRERYRELATLKVLGYYDREISKYIFKENIILTIIGLCFGLIFGTYLHSYIISKAEMPNIFFIKTLPLSNYLLTIFFTLIFTLSVNLIMSRNIKKIDMVESLKSIE